MPQKIGETIPFSPGRVEVMRALFCVGAIALLLVSCEQANERAAPANPESGSAVASNLPIDSFVNAPLYRHDGNRFVAAAVEKKPKYYLLYFSASW